MSDRSLSALLALADTETGTEPALRPGFTEQTLALARRSARRRRTAGALAAAMAVLLAGAIPTVMRVAANAPRPAAPAGSPSLPDRFAGYSRLTATVTKQPAGRAVALYTYGNYELFRTYQPLVVGAERDSYRRVDAIEQRDTSAGYPDALLSPDGTHVLVGGKATGNTDSLTLVDLSSGQRRELRVDPPAWLRLLAWSPDGRYVAYSGAPLSVTREPNEIVDSYVGRIRDDTLTRGGLSILDLATGVSTRFAQLTAVRSTSFAPDSRRLAVQLDRTAWIVTIDGRRERQLPIPEDRELLERHAWAPDGTLIATVPAPQPGPDYNRSRYSNDIDFLDVVGTGHPLPPPVTVGSVLGWRSPSQLLTFDMGDAGTGGTITEVTLGTGQRRPLSRFSTSTSCEYGTSTCQVVDLQLATALLPTLTTRPANDPDRGPWPTWLTVACLVLAIQSAAIGASIIHAIRHRRRLRSSARSG